MGIAAGNNLLIVIQTLHNKRNFEKKAELPKK